MTKTYYKNGTASENEFINLEPDVFSIQCNSINGTTLLFYPGDELIREIEQALIKVSDLFIYLYFSDPKLYYSVASIIPSDVFLGGQNSDTPVNKSRFLELSSCFASYVSDLYRYLYVSDCQYLIATVQNLLQSAEYCFIQYYIQITEVDSTVHCPSPELMICSPQTRQLIFYLETFFTKVYSILDLIVKILFELENPTTEFSAITKLKSSEKLWGNKKKLRINNLEGTLLEDCMVIRQIESLRNETVHNGTWEFSPKVFAKFEGSTIVERYMLFPDFEEGRLSTVKNRRHFFSSGIKVNDALLSIHEEFYHRLLATLQYIIKSNQHLKSNLTT